MADSRPSGGQDGLRLGVGGNRLQEGGDDDVPGIGDVVVPGGGLGDGAAQLVGMVADDPVGP